MPRCATTSRRGSWPPVVRSAGSARRGSWCGWRRRRPRARPGASTSTARSPRTCAGAPAGRRSSRRSRSRRQRAARDRHEDPSAAARRAELEGGVSQLVGPLVPLGDGGFADDGAPRDALVAVPLPPGSTAESVEVAGSSWVVADSLLEARALAGKVQGRRTTVDPEPPLALPVPVCRWRAPRDVVGRARIPRARRVVVRARRRSRDAARQRRRVRRQGRVAGRRGGARARRSHRTHRARRVRTRRRRPPRPQASADRGDRVRSTGDPCACRGTSSATPTPFTPPIAWPYAIEEHGRVDERDRPRADDRVDVARRRASPSAPCCSRARCTSPAPTAASLVRDDRVASVLLDSCVAVDEWRARRRTRHRRRQRARSSVCTCASRPAIRSTTSCCVPTRSVPRTWRSGWVLTEGLAVDPETGEVHDLTIRSFGILRAKDTPPIDVEIVDDPGAPRATRIRRGVRGGRGRGTWNAVSDADGARPESFPARDDACRGCATSLTPRGVVGARRRAASSRSATRTRARIAMNTDRTRTRRTRRGSTRRPRRDASSDQRR